MAGSVSLFTLAYLGRSSDSFEVCFFPLRRLLATFTLETSVAHRVGICPQLRMHEIFLLRNRRTTAFLDSDLRFIRVSINFTFMDVKCGRGV